MLSLYHPPTVRLLYFPVFLTISCLLVMRECPSHITCQDSFTLVFLISNPLPHCILMPIFFSTVFKAHISWVHFPILIFLFLYLPPYASAISSCSLLLEHIQARDPESRVDSESLSPNLFHTFISSFISDRTFCVWVFHF